MVNPSWRLFAKVVRERSEAGAVIEEFAEADGEEKIAEEGVLEASEWQRLRGMVGDGEKDATENAKADGKPVAKDDVYEAEGEGTGEDHDPPIAEEWLVTTKEEGAIEKLLGKNGEDWVEEHNQGPEGGSSLNE